MATFWAGNGGKVTKGGTNINIQEWTMEKSARLVDLTHSGTLGWALYKSALKEASGTVKASWDSTQLVETTLAMDVAAEVTILMYLGTSGKAFTAPIVIEKLSYEVNNQNGFVMYNFSWKNQGAVTGPA